MRGKLFAAAAMAVFCLGAAAPVRADTTDDLLKRLLAKGILTQAEYDQLAQKKADDAANAPVATSPAAGGNTEVATGTAPSPAAAISPAKPEIDPHVVRMSDSGLGLQMGPVLFKISGSINGFYTHDSGFAHRVSRRGRGSCNCGRG